MEVLKVATSSDPHAVAGAIAGVVRDEGSTEVQAIGAGALNQAVKAVAIARSFVAGDGFDLACRPAFVQVMIDGQERTALKLLVDKYTASGTKQMLNPETEDMGHE